MVIKLQASNWLITVLKQALVARGTYGHTLIKLWNSTLIPSRPIKLISFLHVHVHVHYLK